MNPVIRRVLCAPVLALTVTAALTAPAAAADVDPCLGAPGLIVTSYGGHCVRHLIPVFPVWTSVSSLAALPADATPARALAVDEPVPPSSELWIDHPVYLVWPDGDIGLFAPSPDQLRPPVVPGPVATPAPTPAPKPTPTPKPVAKRTSKLVGLSSVKVRRGKRFTDTVRLTVGGKAAPRRTVRVTVDLPGARAVTRTVRTDTKGRVRVTGRAGRTTGRGVLKVTFRGSSSTTSTATSSRLRVVR
jgi:hypothetical protein